MAHELTNFIILFYLFFNTGAIISSLLSESPQLPFSRMKDCYGLLGLYIFWSIDLTFNHVCAVNTPAPSLDAGSSNTGSLNAPDFNNSILNVTSLGAIDPAFDLVPVFRGAKLRPVPCLLNSVNVAFQLALGDFEGPIFETVFRLDSHPQVEIAVIPDEEGGSIPRKYAVWGLNIGIDLMIKELNFQTAIFILSYRDQRVAYITYKVTGTPDSISTNITNKTQSMNENGPLSNTITRLLQPFTDAKINNADTVDSTNDPHLRVAFQLTGSVITIYNIFYMAIDMLRELASFRRTGRFGDNTIGITAANLVLSTRQNNPPRTVQNPPYFQVEWLMRALAQTPAYMLEQRSFREVDMVLFVDEVKVGEVSIRRPRPGSVLLPASDNMSSSS